MEEGEKIINLGGVGPKIPNPQISNNPGNQVTGNLPSARDSFLNLIKNNQFQVYQCCPNQDESKVTFQLIETVIPDLHQHFGLNY